MSSLAVELVAADRKVWEGDAISIRARSADGDIGILPGHTPLLAVLMAGEVRINSGGNEEVVTIDEGFISVDHDRVVIVAERVDAGGLSTPAPTT